MTELWDLLRIHPKKGANFGAVSAFSNLAAICALT
jgi:hypothetical protein